MILMYWKKKIRKSAERILDFRKEMSVMQQPGCQCGQKQENIRSKELEEKKYTKCFDCDKIKDGLVLRTRRSGDYLRVTAKGGKKKLKDYMIDAKIPKEERDSILLLADGPEIWWVVGYRRGESGRVGEDTKAVLQIQIGVGKEENR